jgi:hypothetical protein
MPKKYEAMRDKFKAEGMSDAAAKTKAAKIYNSQKQPGDPTLHGGSSKHAIHPSARGRR